MYRNELNQYAPVEFCPECGHSDFMHGKVGGRVGCSLCICGLVNW